MAKVMERVLVQVAENQVEEQKGAQKVVAAVEREKAEREQMEALAAKALQLESAYKAATKTLKAYVERTGAPVVVGGEEFVFTDAVSYEIVNRRSVLRVLARNRICPTDLMEFPKKVMDQLLDSEIGPRIQPHVQAKHTARFVHRHAKAQ